MRTLTLTLCLLSLSTLTGYAQTTTPLAVSKEAITRLEDLKEITKSVAVTKATKGKVQAEARPEVNRLLVLSTDEFVRISVNKPTKEAYMQCMEQGLARLAPLSAEAQDRTDIADFYQDLLDIVGLPSSEGRLTAFAVVPTASTTAK